MKNFKWLWLLFMFVLSFCMQVSVADWLSIFDVSPDFVIIFIVTVAIKRGPAAGCFWGFLAGFTQDVYAPVEWLGAHSIAMTVIGFVVGQLNERFLTLNMPAKVGVLGLSCLICDGIYFGVTGFSKEIVYNLFLTKSLPGCAYTMLIGSILFYLDVGKKTKHA